MRGGSREVGMKIRVSEVLYIRVLGLFRVERVMCTV